MNRIFTIVAKEFLLLYRDKWGLFGILIFPLLMALFIGMIPYQQHREPNRFALGVVDQDQTPIAQRYVARLKANPLLQIEILPKIPTATQLRGNGCLVLRPGFGHADGVNLGAAPLVECHLTQLEPEAVAALRHLLLNVALELLQVKLPEIKLVPLVSTQAKPFSSFEVSFPLAILWSMMACTSLFAFSIVTERTAGTLLRLRLALNSLAQLLVGKGVACFIVFVTAASFLLAIGTFGFGIRIINWHHLILAVAASAFGFVGIMMLISVMGKTEQAVGAWGQAILLMMMMLGGGMLPLVFMPDWMQIASNVSPVKWGILALEGAMWRQFTLHQMITPCLVLVGIGFTTLSLGAAILVRSENR